VDVDRPPRAVDTRWVYRVGWAALALGIVVAAFLRLGPAPSGPTVIIVALDGTERTLSLEEMKALPGVSRRGIYQNQYGNWRDEGFYEGVLLTELIGEEASYASIRVVAADGYAVTIERSRVEDPGFPIVLAYALDGERVPDWADGFRIAVLPQSGRVGNEDYGVESAGSYWVKNVERIEVQQTAQ